MNAPDAPSWKVARHDRSRPFPWRIELFNGNDRTALHDPNPADVLTCAAAPGTLNQKGTPSD